MDKISVTESALMNARTAIRALSDQVQALTAQCVADLNANVENIDESLRGAIQAYTQMIELFGKSVTACVNENVLSLDERLSRLPDYESQIYKKRSVY